MPKTRYNAGDIIHKLHEAQVQIERWPVYCKHGTPAQCAVIPTAGT